MKKLLLSVLLSISSFCIASNEQIDKVKLQEIKNVIVDVLQMTEKGLNDIAIEYGDLIIVPLKMTNEFLSHNSIQQWIHEISINFTSLIFEKQSLNFVEDYFNDLRTNMNQNDQENMRKIWQDIIEKYKYEPGQNNDTHTLWDLPMTCLMVSFTKIVFDNVLQKIDAIL